MVVWVGVAILFGLVYFAVGTLAVAPLTIVAAAVIGGGTIALVRLLAFGGGPQSRSREVLLPVIATGAGALLQAGFADYKIEEIAGIAVAALAAYLYTLGRTRQQVQRCSVCRTPIAGRAAFVCPRCHQTVCSQPTCWLGQHVRCRLCHERGVVLFPLREDWWTTRLGKPVADGACESCYKEARETDLRECGQCHWPSCRRCWDYHNGRCTRCGWVMPDLPNALRPFVAPSREGRRGAAPRVR